MDPRMEVGHNNMSFQMESRKEHDAKTCDDKAIRNDTPQAKPKVKAQPYKDSDTEKNSTSTFYCICHCCCFIVNSPRHFGFSCSDHDGTERSFDMYLYSFRSSFQW